MHKVFKLIKNRFAFAENDEGRRSQHAPDFIDLEPVLGCNLRCRMCHVSFMKEKVKYLPIDEIDWSFCRDKTVSIGAVFEPLIHPRINQLIDTLNQLNTKIVFITNGHNLNRKEIPALFESNLKEVSFSFDGITKETYEEVRVGGNYNQTLQNIEEFISAHSNSGARFVINYTILKSNLQDVVDAPAFWGKRGVDLLGFIGMVVRENDNYILENSLWDIKDAYFESLEAAKMEVERNKLGIAISSAYFAKKYPEKCPHAVFSNSSNNYFASPHASYGYDKNSVIKNGCVSPFTTARIEWDGSVYLCHNQKIGNLLENKFAEIWNGKMSEDIRCQVIENGNLCKKCDYFKLCIKAKNIDPYDKGNYFSEDFRAKNPNFL